MKKFNQFQSNYPAGFLQNDLKIRTSSVSEPKVEINETDLPLNGVMTWLVFDDKEETESADKIKSKK